MGGVCVPSLLQGRFQLSSSLQGLGLAADAFPSELECMAQPEEGRCAVWMQSGRYSVYSVRLLMPGVASDGAERTQGRSLGYFCFLFLLMTWDLLVLCEISSIVSVLKPCTGTLKHSTSRLGGLTSLLDISYRWNYMTSCVWLISSSIFFQVHPHL